jgi:hypothetical protein
MTIAVTPLPPVGIWRDPDQLAKVQALPRTSRSPPPSFAHTACAFANSWSCSDAGSRQTRTPRTAPPRVARRPRRRREQAFGRRATRAAHDRRPCPGWTGPLRLHAPVPRSARLPARGIRGTVRRLLLHRCRGPSAAAKVRSRPRAWKGRWWLSSDILTSMHCSLTLHVRRRCRPGADSTTTSTFTPTRSGTTTTGVTPLGTTTPPTSMLLPLVVVGLMTSSAPDHDDDQYHHDRLLLVAEPSMPRAARSRRRWGTSAW